MPRRERRIHDGPRRRVGIEAASDDLIRDRCESSLTRELRDPMLDVPANDPLKLCAHTIIPASRQLSSTGQHRPVFADCPPQRIHTCALRRGGRLHRRPPLVAPAGESDDALKVSQRLRYTGAVGLVYDTKIRDLHETRLQCLN